MDRQQNYSGIQRILPLTQYIHSQYTQYIHSDYSITQEFKVWMAVSDCKCVTLQRLCLKNKQQIYWNKTFLTVCHPSPSPLPKSTILTKIRSPPKPVPTLGLGNHLSPLAYPNLKKSPPPLMLGGRTLC